MDVISGDNDNDETIQQNVSKCKTLRIHTHNSKKLQTNEFHNVIYIGYPHRMVGTIHIIRSI